MKIYVLGTRGFPQIQGGVEKHCESLYPLFDNEFKFTVFRRKPYINSSLTYPNIKFIDLPSTKIKGFEAVFHSFLATISACFGKSDVVHIHNIGPALFAPLLRLLGKKVVLTYHSPNYEHAKWGKVAKHILKFSESIALNCSQAIIFVNKFQMQKYPAKVQEKSVYIPNGIPNVQPTSKHDYISSLGLTPGKYVIGVGRITPEKGFDVLIQAFEKLNTDYKLVIVGGVEAESDYEEKLKKLIKSNRVVFTGYIVGEKLNEVYSHAGVYVLSSYNEGFPLVLLEAMSYQLDVLVSDIPATHLIDLKESDYFKPGDVHDLACHLQQKLAPPQKRTYNLSAFDWEKIAQQVMEVYKEVRIRKGT